MSEHKKHWRHKSKKHTVLFAFIIACVIFIAGNLFLYLGSRFAGPPIHPVSGIKDVGLPKRLSIPVIGVDANVQIVGLTPEGRIGIPNNFTDVAWYKDSPRPGQPGSSIIDGHLDTARDANAVFIRLGELKIGDEVYVTDESGESMKFRVVGSEIYDDGNAPLEKIFDNEGKIARLNLITCDGVWSQNKHNYSKRLVVYTKRVVD